MHTLSPVFVGRHEQRRIIEQTLEDARNGSGVGLMIEGLAGTGKSRLVEYALDESARHGFLPLFGIAGEGQEGAPYGLLLDAFRRHIRRQSNEVPAWLDPRSAWTELVSFRPTSLQGPEHAFHEISQALIHHGGPVLLAFEDLHWADRASLDIVESMVRDLADRPLLVLASFREEGLTRDSDRAERIHRLLRHSRVRHLRLAGFSLAETKELVDAMIPAPGDHGFLVRQLHRRTEGNPLFLEELLRSMARDGSDADAALPVSFREAVRSRLTGLTREDTRLLQLASVIGEWFDVATLVHLARRGEAAVMETLARLREQQLIRDTPDRSGFKFWHALSREVFYEQLLLTDRKALHRRIAQRWTGAPAKGATSQPSAIAYHLEKAGEEFDAAQYYAMAAERAEALCAFEEAFAHGERAFVFSRDARGSKALQASRYARLAGHIDAALEYCRRAQDFLVETSDARLRAEILLHESDLQWLSGNGTRAAEILRSVARFREQTGDKSDAAVWAWLLARQAHRAGMESRWTEVSEPADAAIAMSRRLELPVIEAHALISRSMADGALTGTEAGLITLQAGRRLAEQHHSIEDVCRSYVVEVDLRTRDGDFATVCRIAVEGANRARHAGAPVVLFPTLAISAVEFLWKTGRWQEAFDRLPETERLVNEQPSELVRCHFLGVLADIAVGRHRLRDAQMLVTNATNLAQTLHESQWVLPVLVVAAAAALANDQPATALRCATDALQRFPDSDATETRELYATMLEALCRLRENGDRLENANPTALKLNPPAVMGRLDIFHLTLAEGFAAMLAEKPAQAAGMFREAADLAVAMGLPLAEARSREWLARALQKQGTPETRHAAIQERTRARAILESIPGRHKDGGSALETLSEREREVARLVADGLANKEVGARLSISDRTVAVHVSRIFEKVGVDSRHRLAALMAKVGEA